MRVGPKKQFMATGDVDMARIDAAMEVIKQHLGELPNVVRTELEEHVIRVYLAAEHGEYEEQTPTPNTLAPTKAQLERFINAANQYIEKTSADTEAATRKAASDLWANCNANIPLQNAGLDFYRFEAEPSQNAGLDFNRFEAEPLDDVLLADGIYAAKSELQHLRKNYRRCWTYDDPLHVLILGMASHWQDVVGEKAAVLGDRKTGAFYGPFFDMMWDLAQALRVLRNAEEDPEAAFGKTLYRVLSKHRASKT